MFNENMTNEQILGAIKKVPRIYRLTYERKHGHSSGLIVNSLNQMCARAISSSYAEAIAIALNYHDSLCELVEEQARTIQQLQGKEKS